MIGHNAPPTTRLDGRVMPQPPEPQRHDCMPRLKIVNGKIVTYNNPEEGQVVYQRVQQPQDDEASQETTEEHVEEISETGSSASSKPADKICPRCMRSIEWVYVIMPIRIDRSETTAPIVGKPLEGTWDVPQDFPAEETDPPRRKKAQTTIPTFTPVQ